MLSTAAVLPNGGATGVAAAEVETRVLTAQPPTTAGATAASPRGVAAALCSVPAVHVAPTIDSPAVIAGVGVQPIVASVPLVVAATEAAMVKTSDPMENGRLRTPTVQPAALPVMLQHTSTTAQPAMHIVQAIPTVAPAAGVGFQETISSAQSTAMSEVAMATPSANNIKMMAPYLPDEMTLPIHVAPSDDTAVIGTINKSTRLISTEQRGLWLRVQWCSSNRTRSAQNEGQLLMGSQCDFVDRAAITTTASLGPPVKMPASQTIAKTEASDSPSPSDKGMNTLTKIVIFVAGVAILAGIISAIVNGNGAGRSGVRYSSGGSFAAGTLVETSTGGWARIEDVAIGDDLALGGRVVGRMVFEAMRNDIYMAASGVVQPATETKQYTVSEVEIGKSKLDAGFGAWDKTGKVFFLGHVFWLLKETFWVLLIGQLAIGFGLLALLSVGYAIATRLDGGVSGKLYNEVAAEILVGIIHASWLLANFLNLVAGLGFDAPTTIPDYANSTVELFCDSAGAEDYGATILMWLGSCVLLLRRFLAPPQYVAEGNAFQTILLEGGWLTFWVAKDLAWSFGDSLFSIAVASWVVHFVLLVVAFFVAASQTFLLDGLQREEIERIKMLFAFGNVDLPMLSYVFWSIGTLMWLLLDEVYGGNLSLRYSCAAVFCISLIIFLAGTKQAKQKGSSLLLIQRRLVSTTSSS